MTAARLALVIAGLAACDDGPVIDGTRGPCSSGGGLLDCPDPEATPVAACDRLVECGAIPFDGEGEFNFDWGRCVDALEGFPEERARVVLACVSASSCAELRTEGSPTNPYGGIACLSYGQP